MTYLHLFLSLSFSMFSGVSDARSIVLFPIDCCSVSLSCASWFMSVAGMAFKLAWKLSSLLKSRSENSWSERSGFVSVWTAQACKAVA